jgi:thiol-disulfide isomerase/thioredoxin
MKAIQRVTTVAAVLLTLTSQSVAAQQPPAFEELMRKGDQAMQHRQYEEAAQAYRKAYAISKKSSFDAAAASGLAYRALGDPKGALDMAGDALKLAGQDPHQQAQAHNLRGSALYALSAKPDDKHMKEAEAEFRAALAAEDGFQPARFNLGAALLRQNRDEDGLHELNIYVEKAPGGPDAGRAKQLIADPRRARLNFAPPFAFTSRAGEAIALDDLKGKTIVMDFWGSWCPPCRASTPSLSTLHKKYAEQGVVFLGIARDKEKDFAEYVDTHHVLWPQFLDRSGTVLHQFTITGFPTLIVIDGEGIIRGRKMGWGPEIQSWLEDEIKKSLKKSL